MKWHRVWLLCGRSPDQIGHPTYTKAHIYGEVTSCHAGHQEVGRCCTRGEFQGISWMPLPSPNKANHSGFETQRQSHQSKTGYQWPHNKEIMSSKNLKKTKFLFARVVRKTEQKNEYLNQALYTNERKCLQCRSPAHSTYAHSTAAWIPFPIYVCHHTTEICSF